ncbi:MAG: hypothetical protein ACRDN0_07865, partial [Trebonia sp.]
ASSWASMLSAYELWALDDSEIHRMFCAELFRELPAGLDSTPPPPYPLYMTLRDMAPQQIEAIDEMIKKQDEEQRARSSHMRAFWANTLPAALDWPFEGPAAPVGRCLRALEDFVAEGGAAG